jgi:predicted acylesterase/phospholipase RssA
VVYPPTDIDEISFWDGGTVANTPLGPAIDAGAEDIVVVLMTPWEDESNRPRYTSVGGVRGLLAAAQAAFEWVLIASFQADLKLFHRTNEVVQLRAEIAALQSQLREQSSHSLPPQVGGASRKHREVEPPVIVSPHEPIPVEEIIRYELRTHEKLYQMGYEDARAAWVRAGRKLEG